MSGGMEARRIVEITTPARGRSAWNVPLSRDYHTNEKCLCRGGPRAVVQRGSVSPHCTIGSLNFIRSSFLPVHFPFGREKTLRLDAPLSPYSSGPPFYTNKVRLLSLGLWFAGLFVACLPPGWTLSDLNEKWFCFSLHTCVARRNGACIYVYAELFFFFDALTGPDWWSVLY